MLGGFILSKYVLSIIDWKLIGNTQSFGGRITSIKRIGHWIKDHKFTNLNNFSKTNLYPESLSGTRKEGS